MTSSENFKKAMREGKLKEALAIAISQVPELKITTSITPSSPNSATENNSQPQNPPSIKRLHTRINLVEGEIHNEISEDLMGNVAYQEVQQFHFDQVARGHQIIEKNLESLQNMFSLISNVQQQQLEGNYQDIKYLEAQASPLLSDRQTPQQDPEPQIASSGQNLLETTNNLESPPTFIQNGHNHNNSNLVVSPESEAEDWGEWLEEDEQDIDVDLLDLSSLDLDESEDWQDWEGEETQLFAGAPGASSEENKDK